MIRLLLYSQDNRSCRCCLGPTLGGEFEVALESQTRRGSRNKSAISATTSSFWISISGSTEQHRAFVDDMHSARRRRSS